MDAECTSDEHEAWMATPPRTSLPLAHARASGRAREASGARPRSSFARRGVGASRARVCAGERGQALGGAGDCGRSFDSRLSSRRGLLLTMEK
jgi:hypothetical protein